MGVEVGEVLAGKYRVDGVLGAGAMGIVLAAHHLQLDERVALKLLTPWAMQNPEATARFTREARAAVKIKSEHVARVTDVGTLETGAPYIVMEFLEGCDLAAWLDDRGPLPLPLAVAFVLQGCEAIAEAHALGIVHRDLKPANLFVVRRADGIHGSYCVKVLDFGISKMTHGHSDVAATSTSAIMGSPSYMSPEQMRASKNATAQSDIWSIGVTLYELLSGKAPFLGQTFPEICVQIATQPPSPLRESWPEAPPRLEAIITRCLEKEPARRFTDVAELALALAPFAPPSSRSSVERIVGILRGHRDAVSVLADPDVLALDSDPLRHSAVSHTIAPRREPPPPRPRHGWILAATAVVAALVGGLGRGVLHRGDLPRAEATASHQGAAAAGVPTEAVPVGASAVRLPIASAPPPSTASAPIASSAIDAGAQPSMPATHRVAGAPSTEAGHRDLPAGGPERADCTPPFFFDPTGIRVFKKECVH